ncbi:hypothetical protein HNY73_009408 [Argiope bruennichi]|uniref:Uncharacterized protein n=1 Tax=Argiope bruennichi TaxID=94029 RepID=A0A8T0FEM8_ARGBR|nr:hypothetical protein HNY73_009408 [Argiope bruennichi]
MRSAPRPPNMFSYILPILTADNTREGAVQTNERLRLVTGKVSVSYNTVKSALTGLHERYESSKAERNVFRRYALLKGIVKEVIQLDAQYWLLLDVPKQDKQEQFYSNISSHLTLTPHTLEETLNVYTSCHGTTNRRGEHAAHQRSLPSPQKVQYVEGHDQGRPQGPQLHGSVSRRELKLLLILPPSLRPGANRTSPIQGTTTPPRRYQEKVSSYEDSMLIRQIWISELFKKTSALVFTS